MNDEHLQQLLMGLHKTQGEWIPKEGSCTSVLCQFYWKFYVFPTPELKIHVNAKREKGGIKKDISQASLKKKRICNEVEEMKWFPNFSNLG